LPFRFKVLFLRATRHFIDIQIGNILYQGSTEIVNFFFIHSKFNIIIFILWPGRTRPG